MNRIHRRVWSTALQCWVVVSELTRMRGKRAQTVCRSAAVAALLTTLPLAAGAAETTEEELDWWQWQTLSAFQSNGMLPSSVGTKAVHRLDVYNNTTASAWSLITAAETMAVGAEAHAGGVESIAVGIRSKSSGPNSVAVGNRAETYGTHAIAVGFGSRANSVGTVSVGNAARSDGHNAMAIGSGATSAGSGAIALGGDTRARAEGSIVLGDFAEVANSSSRHSIAIGNHASAGGYADSMALGRAARAHGPGKAMALGADSKADHTYAVALGADSETTGAHQISVGNSSLKRKIVNVADGAVNASSTDVVNGRQLNAVSVDVRTALSTANTAKSTADRALAATGLVTQTSASSAIRVGGANSGTVIDVANQSGARRRIQNLGNGVLSTTSTDAVTGQQLHATNQAVTAATSTAAAAKAAADSAAAKAAALAYTTATGTGMTASNKAAASGTGALASGTYAIAEGTHATALGYRAQATANQATALGRESAASGIYSTAVGNLASAVGGRGVALGDRSSVTHGNAVALGAGSVSASDNSVSVGSAALRRKIQYVADGAITAGSTDAVTGSQLHSTNLGVAAAKDVADAASLTAGTAKALVEAVAGQLGSTRIALGDSALADGAYATAIGHVSVASGERAVAMGVRSKASGKYANALGSGAQATGDEATALGRETRASATSATAVGNQAVASHTNAVALGAGSVTASANSVSVGSASNKRRIQHVDDGNLAVNSTDAVTGGQLHATNSNVAKAQGAAGDAHAAANVAQTTADGAVARATALEGLVSQTSANGNLRLGVANTGTTLDVRNKDNRNRTLTGLASAVLDGNSTEAVAGKQLYATNQLVDSQAQMLAMHGQQLSGHAQQLVAQDGRIARNRTDLDKLREDVDNFDPDLDGVVKFNGDRSLVDMNGARVVGVAAGDISSAASSEAVNGGQLFATNSRLQLMEEQGRFFVAGSDEYSVGARAGDMGVAVGDGAEASLSHEGATAIGAFATAGGKNSVALGRASHVHEDAEDGFALGGRSQVAVTGGVALGAESEVMASATNGVAVGYQSIAKDTNTVSFGNDQLQRRLVNIAHGIQANDAITVSQLTQSLTALGGGAGLDTNGNVVAPTYNMQSATQNTVGDALIALDGAVITAGTRVDRVESQLRSTFQEAPSVRSDGLNQLTLAGANGMVLGNVANGLVAAGSREAVNGGQLYAAEQKIERNRSDLDEIREQLIPLPMVAASGPIDFSGARLTGIADGVIGDDSDDAVTGRQLHASNNQILDNRSDINRLREDMDGFNPDLEGVVKFNGDRTLVDMHGARVSGVAAGDISSSASTDGVNGGQLFSSNQRISEVESKVRLVSSNVPAGLGHAQAGLFGLAIGAEAEASLESEGATAIGHFALAQARNSVALGRAAFVDRTATNGFALGTGANVLDEDGTAIGAMSQIEAGAKRSVALGFGSVATQADTVSVGNSTLQRRITEVARGRDGNDVTTVTQLNDSLATLGGGARVDANGRIVGPTFNVQGAEQKTLGDALATLDGAVISSGTRVDRVENQLRSVFQDAPSLRSDGFNQLNLAGANGMVLGNVANGLVAAGSRDAVNGGQLHAVQQRLDGRIDGVEQRLDGTAQGRAMASADAPPVPQAEEAPQASGTPDIASAEGDKGGNLASADDGGKPSKADAPAPAPTPTPQVSTADLEKMLARANEYTDDAIKGVEQRLDKMDKRFNRLAAMNSAQSAMAMNTAGLATYNRLGAGVGYSDGESAMAVGYQRVLNEKGSATFSLNGAFTNSGEQSVGLGVGIGW
ncbi:ESPR-type extended signal peptide-containing protein [Stenotrophomonas rhizophila]|uniref:ESPR-type extended signal peptide-containing protein n=1 Tax=Stenotrophomonas rhizophila TaxID=216778 RepID=UPI002A6B6397|nr:ESPR-type extended signal peptide-containing protein [Stenotrophomonas rhizophila]MDY0954541.1 ESPR-type extended signal peptide-containing protein [Stenotrophomonas rhizophila]